MKSVRYYIIILVLILLFATIFLSLRYKEALTDSPTIEIVVARYAEDLNWLQKAPFNAHPNIIYNKGVDEEFYTNAHTRAIVPLKNVGRCDETYLNHIVNHYSDLADITVFLPGSADMEDKMPKAMTILENVEEHMDTVFLAWTYNNVREELYDFHLDEWKASGTKNSQLNPETKLELSAIRPFGKWYEAHFDWDVQHVSYFGILAISKRDILNHPIEYYQRILSQLQNSSNPEIGHYVERSWEAIFYKFHNPKYIVM
jgi:hypothetical protein